MNYLLKRMSQKSALEIANHWRYTGIYSFYNADQDEEDYNELVHESLRGDNYYEALQNEELVGYFSIERKNDSVEIGLGLRPDLCGMGEGACFLKQIEAFILSRQQVNNFILKVASFNTRAIKVYKLSGYKVIKEEEILTNGNYYKFKVMEKVISPYKPILYKKG